jgi:hypothetical protein
VTSSELIYLDPHIIQDVIPVINNLEDCESYHSDIIQLMNIQSQNIASSLVPSFYLRDLEDFEAWKHQMILMHRRYKMNFVFSLFFDTPRQITTYDETSSQNDSIDFHVVKMNRQRGHRDTGPTLNGENQYSPSYKYEGNRLQHFRNVLPDV